MIVLIMPRIIVIVLEDELTKNINVPESQMNKDYTRRIKWLMSEYRKIIDTIKDYIPQNAKTESEPKLVWIIPSRHKNYPDNLQRKKFGHMLENQAKFQENTMALRLVQRWDYEDGNLYFGTRAEINI